MWCCAADAIAHGILIPSEPFSNLQTGSWIKVYGQLKKTSESVEVSIPQSVAPYHEITQNWFFTPDEIIDIEEPKDPYIIRWSHKEPFRY
jgi:uncharacterized membrane protein YcgQ (UPF0703/DUF1980 family)